MDSVIPFRNIHINMGIINSGTSWGSRSREVASENKVISPNICQAPFLAEFCWRQEGEGFAPQGHLPCVPQSEMHSPNGNTPPGVSRVSLLTEGQIRQLSMVAYRCQVKVQDLPVLTLFRLWFATTLRRCIGWAGVRGWSGSTVAPVGASM